MTSDFNKQISRATDNEWIPIGEKGGRFEFFKVRIYGSLHFVKRISPEYGNDLVASESLRKEFSIGYPLNHPNIVRYLQYDGIAVYEEFIDGDTLRTIIERKDIRLKNPAFIRKICNQTLEALKYLHQNGILHLDLKPENIMITRVGDEVKIIDFGGSINAVNDSIPGYTLEYMAPEQLNSEVNTYTDIYQLGMIMKELVEISGTKRKWKNFIRKSTAHHPADRFKNDDEALKALPGISPKKLRNVDRIIAILIIGALASVIIKNKIDTNSPLPPAAETSQDLKIIEPEIKPESNQSKEEKTETAPKPVTHKLTEEETERMLYKKINQQLDVLYGVEVYPMYERMMNDSAYKFESGREKEFRNAFYDAWNKLVEYGNELAKEHPEYENYIYDQVMRACELKNYRMVENLYPSYTKNSQGSQEIAILSTDTIK